GRFISYQWNGSITDTNEFYVVTKPGKYYVDVIDVFGFHSSDTINITYPFNQPTNNILCFGDTLVWNTGLNKSRYNFLWKDGSTDSLLAITGAGSYYVKVTDTQLGCVKNSDTLVV